MEESLVRLLTAQQNSDQQDVPLPKNWCYTKLKVIPYIYMWAIDNFSLRPEEVGEYLKSPTFPDGSKEKIKWNVLAYPKGKNEESRDYLSLSVQLVSRDESEVRTKIKFTITNTSGHEIRTLESSLFVFGEGKMSCCFWKFLRTDYLLDKAKGRLPDDKLIICCQIRVINGSIDISGKSDTVQIKPPERCLSEDLESLLENPQFSDVTLSVGERELQAHKGILVARSPVFQAMFQHQMEENKSNRVDIKDVEYEVLSEMLQFIYTGKVSSLEDTAYDLLSAADKYGLEGLKNICEKELCTNHLTVENAAELLVLADLHSATQLKAQTMDFIKRHATNVMDTPGWKSMTESNSHLILEVCKALATHETWRI